MTAHVHARRSNPRGHRYGGSDGFAPTTTPRPDTLAVTCPTCDAGEGDRCVTAKGEPMRHSHGPRTRMAIRAMNRRLVTGTPDRAYVRTLTPIERRKVRKTAGLTQTELADLLGVSRSCLADVENGDVNPTTEWSARYGAWLRKQRTMTEGSTFTEALAGEIRARMGRRNITVSALAERTGYANSTLARKVKGETPFTTVELETVAKELDTSIQALILSVRVPA